MASKRKTLLWISSIVFFILMCRYFYLIHIAKADIDYTMHYECIIAAAFFAWLTLIINLITAKEANQKTSRILFSLTDGNLLRIAMIFTLVADYYLVALSEPDYFKGVSVFLGTQLFIFLHIFANEWDRKWRKINIFSRILLTIIVIFVAYCLMKDMLDLLSIISIIYYCNLCANAFFAPRIGRGGLILTLGLILFALCDINVGLAGLEEIYVGGFAEGSFLYNILHTEQDLIWIFYIPSQTLIPLSLVFSQRK